MVCKHKISTYLRWYTVAATYIIRHAAHSLAAFMGVRFDLIARRTCWNLHCWATVISLHNLKLSVRCSCNACISETLIFIRPHLSNLFHKTMLRLVSITLNMNSLTLYTCTTRKTCYSASTQLFVVFFSHTVTTYVLTSAELKYKWCVMNTDSKGGKNDVCKF